MTRKFLIAAGVLLAGACAADLSSAPVPMKPLYTLFSSDDYPSAALRGEEQGVTAYELGIGTDGRADRCAVTRSSGSAALDAATCRLLQRRARFAPALDRKGRPVGSAIGGTISWRLPEG